MDGIAAVEARIQEILSQFGAVSPSTSATASSDGDADVAAAASGSSSDFASLLAGLTDSSGTSATSADSSVPMSSGTTNPAGVDPIKWARDFLTELGMPITSENVRAIQAWELAEGTKAHFNPLATTQGHANSTRFNSVGVKNYATYQDGLDSNVKALTNGYYANILAALRQGTSADAVAQAIANSPWGTGTGVERVLASGQV